MIDRYQSYRKNIERKKIEDTPKRIIYFRGLIRVPSAFTILTSFVECSSEDQVKEVVDLGMLRRCSAI